MNHSTCTVLRSPRICVSFVVVLLSLSPLSPLRAVLLAVCHHWDVEWDGRPYKRLTWTGRERERERELLLFVSGHAVILACLICFLLFCFCY